jgi:sugar/nucleoside kinase (ribokinase family)
MDLLSPGTPKLLARIEPMLGELDYLLPNEEQLMGLAGESDLGAASRAILARGVSCVGVTRGSSGSLVDDGAQSIELPAFDVDVVDTTGCGDAFSAGFITGTTLGWTVSESAWLGTAAAALVATGLGSDAGIVDLPSTIDFMHEHRQRLAVARAGSAEGRPK